MFKAYSNFLSYRRKSFQQLSFHSVPGKYSVGA